jgi:hypothetical protein
METLKIQKIAFSFECDNCRQLVTEKMLPVEVEFMKQTNCGVYCDVCCDHAERYYQEQDYQAFLESEENQHY